MHANPVEAIRKDIYIIKNDINNKVYIGQSENSKIRFKQHCKKNNLDNSVIGKVIKKYGKEHFWYEILESKVLNYNEREKYWISYYNSMLPNGYNILPGGDEPPHAYGEDSAMAKISNAELSLLIHDLEFTKISLSLIAHKYGISKKQVLRINTGVSRFNPNISYPIRKTPNINGKLDDADIDEIIYMLKYTYLFDGEIAKRFGVDVHAISRINNGQAHRRDDIDYPIRKWKSCGTVLFTYDQVTEIINLLKNTDISINKIAKMYNVYFQSIAMINDGSAKKYRRPEIIYPIRNF